MNKLHYVSLVCFIFMLSLAPLLFIGGVLANLLFGLKFPVILAVSSDTMSEKDSLSFYSAYVFYRGVAHRQLPALTGLLAFSFFCSLQLVRMSCSRLSWSES